MFSNSIITLSKVYTRRTGDKAVNLQSSFLDILLKHRFKYFWWVCFHICTLVPTGKRVYFSSWGDSNMYWHHSKFREDVNRNKQKWHCCQRKGFSGASDILMKNPILLLTLCRWCFSCLQMYSEKVFNIYSHSKYFFKFLRSNLSVF